MDRRSSNTPDSVTRDAIERAERTLNVQRERFDRVDQKAATVLQFVALTLGAVLTVVAVAPGGFVTRLSVGVRAISPVSAAGVLTTVLLAVTTYVTTRFRSSFGSSSATLLLEVNITRERYDEFVLRAYRDAIETNAHRIDTNVRLLSFTLYALAFSIATLTLTVLFLVLPLSVDEQVAIGAVGLLGFLLFLLFLTGRNRRQAVQSADRQDDSQ